MWLPVISILWTVVYLLRRKDVEKRFSASFTNGKVISLLCDTRESEYFTTTYEAVTVAMGFTQRGTRKTEGSIVNKIMLPL
ncbi:hypothetical protein KPH14_003430 [Odynerus spinipes]|uniref:Uncharacterized protein n=1 Tax=Odynerus spinipes TaxID=1348599 RepID=A0AAD9RE05_9HYME|nr:hypothetical protein KPH14_003430 [Odynerus spinipes]